MSTVDLVDVSELLHDTSELTSQEIDAYVELMNSPQLPDFRREVSAAVQEVRNGSSSKPLKIRAGVCSYLLGEHEIAEETLEGVRKNGIAAWYHAQSLKSLRRYEEAEKKFEEADKAGWDHVDCVLQQAGMARAQNKLDDAEKLIKTVAKNGAGRAEYSFQIGCLWEERGDINGAVEYFERAVDMDTNHSEALFRLANIRSIRGEDDEAIRLYEQSLSKPPYFQGALLNLGVLYEDKENYAAAAYCFRKILESDPNHPRARLFLKDIDAVSDMYYDEDQARLEARLEQLLKRPITDFELSVRSRNCLQNMGIYTLGDLTRVSENELLAGKNFGETSLKEIRELMQAHNLQIGQNLHKAKAQEAIAQQQNLSPQEQAMMNKPVADLNLSVRSRKCMVRLGITTFGELLARTPDELLGSRNFGVTSLNEIRAKLSEIGLKLKND